MKLGEIWCLNLTKKYSKIQQISETLSFEEVMIGFE